MSNLNKKYSFIIFFIVFVFNIIIANNKRLRIINADYLESNETPNGIVQKLSGNVILETDKIRLFTNMANYYNNSKEFHLLNNVKMIENSDTLTCSKMIHYSFDEPYLVAIDKVNFIYNKSNIKCDSLIYWTELDSSFAYGNVYMVNKKRELTTKKFSFWKSSGYRGSSFIAIGNSILKENNRIISAFEMNYNDENDLLLLNNNCVINDGEMGLSGNEIYIQYSDSIIQKINVTDNAKGYNDFLGLIDRNKSKQKFRNNMFGNMIEAKFINNEIDELLLYDMASTFYHVLEDSVINGTNDASGDTIIISLYNKNLSRIEIIGGGRGLFEPEKINSNIDSSIIYQGDYIDYHVNDKKTYLTDNAIIENEGTVLTSGHIIADWNTNLLKLESIENQLPTVDTPDGEPLNGNFMEFDLITKQGRIIKGKTSFNNSIYYGEKIFRDEPNIFHVKSSKYTSCDADVPHFYLASRKMKMITGDRIISRPLWLYVYDIPLIGLPLAVFPNKGGNRHSGWIMPAFGHRNSDGTYFQGLGYYWAPNDYIDYRILVNFYDKRGFKTFSKFNYIKKYNYNGTVTSTLNRNIISNNIQDIISGSLNQNWDIRWKHNWTIDPTQNMNINWTYMSSNSYYQDTLYAHTQETRLQQKLESSANYSKQWSTYKNSLSINVSESTDLLKSEINMLDHQPLPGEISYFKTRYLPRLTLRHGQTKLFGNGGYWYNTIYWSISSGLTRLQKFGWQGNEDSTWVKTNINDNTDKSITHSLTFSSPQKFFGWLTLNPRINLKEDWIFRYRDYDLTDPNTFILVDSFLPRHTGSLSLSANTKIYGLFPFSIGTIESFRHILSPSISYSFRPDFSKDFLGIDLGYFESDSEGNLYDKFAGSMVGSTPKQEQKTVGINLNNQFQIKVKDIENNYIKFDILTWNINTSYNFAADSLNLSTIRSSIRTTLPGGFNLDLSMTHDLYKLKLDPDYQSLRRINIFGKPRLTSVSSGTSMRFSSKKLLGFNDNTESIDSILYSENNINEPLPELSKNNLWESNMSFRYALNQIIIGDEIQMNKTFWMNSSLKINLSEKWSLQHTARFDLIDLKMVYHKFNISRPLHCWMFSFNWTPTGIGRGFYLKINVINPDLQDIKLESKGGKSFYNF